LELKTAPGDALKDLTDEELEAAIAALDELIRTAAGLPADDFADDLSWRRNDGRLPAELSPEVVELFVRSFKQEFAANG
jgi:hypothetical protein